MISIAKRNTRKVKEEDGSVKDYEIVELRGLSTDTKPTEIEGNVVDNGSVFIEIDTQKIAFYDLSTQTWKEV